jgi:hypothetical protein
VFVADEGLTATRRKRLERYLVGNVDDGQQLVCTSADWCRRSMRDRELLVEGQLSHVGRTYDLLDLGRPLRIAIVSKQVGGSLDHGGNRGYQHVSVAERSRQVDTAKYGARPHPRTNHMVGTELALKVLLGLDPRADPVVELAGSDPAHVFDCMALLNATLCSRVGSDSSGQGSTTMFSQCRAHLAHSFEILEPNVVVAEGWTAGARGPDASVAGTVAQILGVRSDLGHAALATVMAPWGPVAFVCAYHPARHWFTTSRGYWQQLEPVLEHARAHALSWGGWADRKVPPTADCHGRRGDD